MRHLRSLGLAIVILGARLPAAATTPTPTSTPTIEVRVRPQRARSGQTVFLSVNRTTGDVAPQWTQIAGPPVALLDAATRDPSFVAPPVAERTTLEFRLSMPPYPDTREVEVTVVPADAIAVDVQTDADGPSGGLAELGVAVDPLDLSLAGLRHELGFGPEAAVADRDAVHRVTVGRAVAAIRHRGLGSEPELVAEAGEGKAERVERDVESARPPDGPLGVGLDVHRDGVGGDDGDPDLAGVGVRRHREEEVGAWSGPPPAARRNSGRACRRR